MASAKSGGAICLWHCKAIDVFINVITLLCAHIKQWCLFWVYISASWTASADHTDMSCNLCKELNPPLPQWLLINFALLVLWSLLVTGKCESASRAWSWGTSLYFQFLALIRILRWVSNSWQEWSLPLLFQFRAQKLFFNASFKKTKDNLLISLIGKNPLQTVPPIKD